MVTPGGKANNSGKHDIIAEVSFKDSGCKLYRLGVNVDDSSKTEPTSMTLTDSSVLDHQCGKIRPKSRSK